MKYQMVDFLYLSQNFTDFWQKTIRSREELIEKLEELDKRMTSYEMTFAIGSEPYD